MNYHQKTKLSSGLDTFRTASCIADSALFKMLTVSIALTDMKETPTGKVSSIQSTAYSHLRA